MIGVRLLCLFGYLATPALAADSAIEERIAAHFQAGSSRLRPEDAEPVARFVTRARTIPGARLALLIPITTEPARSRFVAARVTELERHVEALAEWADYRRIVANANTDVLWLALTLPVAAEDTRPSAPPVASQPVDLAPPSSALTAPAIVSAALAPALAPADIRLGDWVVRGIKRPPQGPVSAYVSRTAPGAMPREIFEHQADRELGWVKEISLSPEMGWVVRTEIGWIGQGSPASSP